MRDLVPDPFNAVEELLHKRLRRRGLDDRNDGPLLRHAPASFLSLVYHENVTGKAREQLAQPLRSGLGAGRDGQRPTVKLGYAPI
jgi:hypothetical protein